MVPQSPEFPRRLVEGENETATLIGRALAEPLAGPSEQESWLALQSRLAPSAPRWILPAVALGLAAVAALFWFGRPSPAPSLGPDVWQRSRASVTPLPAPSRLESEAAALPRVPTDKPKTIASAPHESEAPHCSALAKAGHYDAAAACYGRAASGNSMDAELSLYEKARLEAKALGKSSLALATLDEHARRFPGGVLTTEVELTRIELLSQVGRSDEALAAINRGLSGALGRERGADLQVLRAELLAAKGDCPAALEAAQLARQAGAHPSRLQTIEHRCPAAP
jgi:tetratricopeptide (TPR) repeat protein